MQRLLLSTRAIGRAFLGWHWMVALLLLVSGLVVFAQGPTWWSQRSVLTLGGTADDFALINQGQIKQIALAAFEEIEAKIPGGAGSALAASLDAWTTLDANNVRIARVTAATDDFATVNVGQARALAKPFYDRLVAVGRASGYPWSDSVSDDDDFALVNLGQVKNLFSFDLGPGTPTGLSATPDNIQITLQWNAVPDATFYRVLRATASGGPYQTLPGAQIPGPGVTPLSYTDAELSDVDTYFYLVVGCNAQAWSFPSNVASATVIMDSDENGLRDSWEIEYFSAIGQDPAADPDGDGLSNLQESRNGANPLMADTDGDGIPDGWEVTNGLNPLVDDSLEDNDGDRVPNLFEYKWGTLVNDAASKPAATFIVDPATGGDSPTDNIYATIQEAVDEAGRVIYNNETGSDEYVNAFAIIAVKAGVYREAVNINSPVPVLLLGELGSVAGPVEIRGNPVSEGYALQLNASCVVDGVVVTHEPGVKASGVYVSSWGGKKRLVNCIIRNNQATDSGGGIYADYNADLVLDHCTVCGNIATYFGTGIFSNGARITLRNSILWNPVLMSDPNLADQEVYRSPWTTGRFEVINSIVGGGEQGGLNIDPQLTSAGWLKSTSPAINRAGVSVVAALDIHGELRQQPDLGADEFVDADGDGLPDWWELRFFGDLSKGSSDDGDNDGVSALQEYVDGTNPLLADTDGDGLNDGAEKQAGTNPLVPDTDGDGIPDGWEVANGLNSLVADSLEDNDGDLLPNLLEFRLGTNPFLADTNGDGLPDGVSFALGIDPISLDIDGDGVSNADELRLGTSPWLADTDGDGVNDALDAFPLDPTRWDLPTGSPGDTTPPIILLLTPREAKQIWP